MPTLRDVANLAGVSTATVSHVVNNSRRTTAETRERVERAIEQVGFTPNLVGRMLALQKNGGHAESIRTVEQLTPTSNIGTPLRAAEGRVSLHASSNSPEGRGDALALLPGSNSNTNYFNGTTARTLLKIIRAAQPISRADLARRLEVNRSTVTEIVKPLLAAGVLREGAPQTEANRTGRPPIGLSLRAERDFFIGVNIGVRRTQVGAATAAGQVLAEEAFDTSADPAETLQQARATLLRLASSVPERRLSLIGVSVPGPTDPERTRLLYAPHLGWDNVRIAEALSVSSTTATASGSAAVPVIVENDATAAAIYEARRRLRHSTDGAWSDFVLVRAGTGIGVGLVLGGEVYRGTGAGGGVAGEFGHMTIVAGGKPCACGNRGCWERYASASAAVSLYIGDRAATIGSTGVPRFVDIVAKAEAGERRAQATLEKVGEYLGIGISNVVSGVGVGRVVVSGRVVYGWRFIAEPLKETLRRTMAGRLTHPTVEAGEATGAGLGGALEVAIDQHLAELAVQTRVAA